MRISDWSSDVCSSDLQGDRPGIAQPGVVVRHDRQAHARHVDPRRGQPGTGMVLDVAVAHAHHHRFDARSEERRVGKECVRTCISRWWPYSLTQTTNIYKHLDTQSTTHINTTNY